MRNFGHRLGRRPPGSALRQAWVFVLLGIFSAMGMAATMDRYFETSDGLQLHYLEAGSGERTLLFVPGWLMPAAVFEAQLAGLSREFRVIAFDPRSQGLSQVSPGSHRPEIRLRDMNELLTAASVGDFILAGWSLGVLETLDFIEQHRPSRLRGLILIDNSIGEGNPPPPSRRNQTNGHDFFHAADATPDHESHDRFPPLQGAFRLARRNRSMGAEQALRIPHLTPRPLPRPARHRGPAAAARSSAPRNPAFVPARGEGRFVSR
jgi:pimeloyl-ACP methyl ester carboxylesterase